MLEAVDFKDGKIGILDTEDGSIEYASTTDIKKVLDLGIKVVGITIEADLNPIYTLDRLTVNLYYQNIPQLSDRYSINVLDRFKFVLLNKGNRVGVKFKGVVEKPTVFVYDLGSNFPKYKFPCGQFICSYYAETLLGHNKNSGLIFDADVPDWRISAKDMQQLNIWIKHILYERWGYNQ